MTDSERFLRHAPYCYLDDDHPGRPCLPMPLGATDSHEPRTESRPDPRTEAGKLAPDHGPFVHDELDDVLAEMFGLKRVKRRNGKWIAEFFGGTEMPLADLWANREARLSHSDVSADPIPFDPTEPKDDIEEREGRSTTSPIRMSSEPQPRRRNDETRDDGRRDPAGL